MSRYFKTSCAGEAEAIAAYEATDAIFDSLKGVTSFGRKRHAADLLWRFDDPQPTVRRMLNRLRKSGRFMEIQEIPEREFWEARSYGC